MYADITITKGTATSILHHKGLLHPNIIQFREVYRTKSGIYIAMEFASGGPLDKRLEKPLSESVSKSLFRQLVDGMLYCHDQDTFHRGLQIRTCTLLLHGTVYDPLLKIAGFSNADLELQDLKMRQCYKVVSPAAVYTPPEDLLCATLKARGNADQEQLRPLHRASDVWASGVVLYRMLAGHYPFVDPAEPDAVNARLLQRIVKGRYEFPSDRVEVTACCLDLLSRIFQTDPADRITAAEMKDHPWLSGVRLSNEASPSNLLLPSPQTNEDIIQCLRRRRSSTKP
ncbi:hypothetical protein WJX73_001088 [Symbiochloris irregularis]|uniref:non-specific serine/threonine protein kinase n=1 Tax=Symbiochloris irregularis TaxID=706552 RepID=A0AAW1PIW2_9CHLO